MAKSTYSDSIVELLQDQVVMELGAEMEYHSLATWCEVNNFSGFAHWFKKQSTEERLHAERIIDYLVKLDITPYYGSIEVEEPEFDNLTQIFTQVLASEQAITSSIHDIYSAAISENDHSSSQFLLWFIQEQREEEANANKMLELVKITEEDSLAALLEIDRRAGVR